MAAPTAATAGPTAVRRDRLRPALAATGADRLLVTLPANVRYLAGFGGTNGQLVVGPDPADDRLITDERYEGRAALEAPDLPVILDRDPVGVAVDLATDAATGGRAGAAHLAFEAHHLTWRQGEELRDRAFEVGVEVIPTDDLVEGLRLVKDDAEVAALARACEVTTEALDELLTQVVAPGRTERELAVWLERRFVDLGADGVAFPSIVASGPNAAVPHHAPGVRPLQSGDLLTVDCGALVDGYHADCTRTVAIGHLDDELAEVYALVEAAQSAGLASVVVGASAGDVDAACREMIEMAGHGDQFLHGTGHGVGLAIHEAPAVAADVRTVLEPGMTLTVEPGVYLPGRGGVRIEDTVVVTADGLPRVLTELPRTLRMV